MKRIIIICTKQYDGYAENIQNSYDNIKVYGGYDIDNGLKEIQKNNPGAVIFLNYYKSQDYESGLVIEHIGRIRSVTEHQIIILSSVRPSTDFIVQANGYGVKVLWGKEIDFDIDNIPETELPRESLNEPELEESHSAEVIEDRNVIVCLDDFMDLITVPYYFVDKFEAIPVHINENTKAVITTSSKLSAGGFTAVKAVIRKIPKSVKLYAIDNTRLNQLIYGEIGKKEDVKFYPVDQVPDLINDILGVQPEVSQIEIQEKVQVELSEPANEGKKKFRFNFESLSEKLSTVVEATKSISRPEIKIPKLQFMETEPKKKDTSKKIEFIERSKILLVMSPISTGKTEISSNLAAALADSGLKTALVDLDTSKKGCFYSFPLFEKEHLFILRKVCMHLENDNLEDSIESYGYKSGDLYVYTSHRDVEIEVNKVLIKKLLRYLKVSFDVVVIDVGRDLPKDILESLMDTDGIMKLLVTTQNIEHLNTIPYYYKWFSKFPLYYKSWTLIVNRYIENGGVSDSDIELYFQDPEQGDELSFEITKKYNIHDSLELQRCKSKRSIVYGKDKVFSESIRNIADDWKKGMLNL